VVKIFMQLGQNASEVGQNTSGDGTRLQFSALQEEERDISKNLHFEGVQLVLLFCSANLICHFGKVYPLIFALDSTMTFLDFLVEAAFDSSSAAILAS